MDKTTDAFTVGTGRVIGAAAASVANLTEYTDTSTKRYVKIGDATNGYAFPRVATAVTGVGYNSKDNGYLVFQNTCRVPTIYKDKLTALGFLINGDSTWYNGTLTAADATPADRNGYSKGTVFRAHYIMPDADITGVQAKANFGGAIVTSSALDKDQLAQVNGLGG